MESFKGENINNLKNLLATYRKTLVHLQLQAGKYGGEPFAPPQVAHGVHEAKEHIYRIKAALRKLNAEVEEDFIEDLLPPGNALSPKTIQNITPKVSSSAFVYKKIDDVPEIIIGYLQGKLNQATKNRETVD